MSVANQARLVIDRIESEAVATADGLTEDQVRDAVMATCPRIGENLPSDYVEWWSVHNGPAPRSDSDPRPWLRDFTPSRCYLQSLTEVLSMFQTLLEELEPQAVDIVLAEPVYPLFIDSSSCYYALRQGDEGGWGMAFKDRDRFHWTPIPHQPDADGTPTFEQWLAALNECFEAERFGFGPVLANNSTGVTRILSDVDNEDDHTAHLYPWLAPEIWM